MQISALRSLHLEMGNVTSLISFFKYSAILKSRMPRVLNRESSVIISNSARFGKHFPECCIYKVLTIDNVSYTWTLALPGVSLMGLRVQVVFFLRFQKIFICTG